MAPEAASPAARNHEFIRSGGSQVPPGYVRVPPGACLSLNPPTESARVSVAGALSRPGGVGVVSPDGVRLSSKVEIRAGAYLQAGSHAIDGTDLGDETRLRNSRGVVSNHRRQLRPKADCSL
jgi:hypothetical protein